jgi:hypothetical protein
MKYKLILDAVVGTNVYDVCMVATQIANLALMNVHVDFNGCKLVAQPKGDYRELIKEYWAFEDKEAAI